MAKNGAKCNISPGHHHIEITNLKISQLQHMSAIQFSYEPTSLPSRFDARQVKDCKSEFQHWHFWKAQISVNEYTHQHLLTLSQEWPGLISPVEDQGWCSSSWAVATAAVAGDRYASS